MKVVAAGSEGALMQATIPHLLARGCEVVGIDNQARHGRVERQRAYQFREADLTSAQVAEEAVAGADVVIQAAATLYGVGGYHRWPGSILANDVALHGNLLRAAAKAGVRRFVYISSSMVYERCIHEASAEDDPCINDRAPSTGYGLSKLVGERMCRAFTEETGLECTVWRPFNLISADEDGEEERGISHVFADFKRAIVDERRNVLPLIGDGYQVRCFTWIDDVARAIAEFSDDPRTAGEAFNLGHPRPVTMRELAQMIFDGAKARGLADAGKALSFEPRETFGDDVRHRVPVTAKAWERLGWRATTTLEESLERCFDVWAAKARGGASE